MLRYSKALPLALLFSLPVMAMERERAVVSSADTLPSELTETLLVHNQIAQVLSEEEQLKKDEQLLNERKKSLASVKNLRAEQADKKYTAKITEIAGIRALLDKTSEQIKENEKRKKTALEELEKDTKISQEKIDEQLRQLNNASQELLRKYEQSKSLKEAEHDALLSPLYKAKSNKEAELEKAQAARQALFTDLQLARQNPQEETSKGWFSSIFSWN